MTRRTSAGGIVVVLAVIVVAVVVRRHFFYGKFLDADDLSQEQQYRRCRRRLR